MAADVMIVGMGTIYQLQPVSQEAKDWVAENVHAESYMWMGEWLCVEHRYIRDIYDGLRNAGFTIDMTL